MYMCGVTVAEPRPLPDNLTDKDIIEAAEEALISDAAPGAECKNLGKPRVTKKGASCGKYANNRVFCNSHQVKFEVTQECEGCTSKTLQTEGHARCVFLPDPSALPGSSHLGSCLQKDPSWDGSKLDCSKHGRSQGVQ